MRARALNEVSKSIDTLIEVRDDPDAKGSERIRAAEALSSIALLARSKLQSAIPFATDVSQASPTEIIEGA